MHISIRYGFAFLCVPKCASTSIESAVGKHSEVRFSDNPHLKHINARDFNETLLAYILTKIPNANIESFCLMREPTDWVFSWYRFRQRPELKNPKHPGSANYTGDISFNEFVDAYTSPADKPAFADIATQRNYFLMPDGSIGVDRVFDMNRLDLVAKFLSEKMAMEVDLPSLNTSEDADYSLDAALEQRLHEYLAIDYRIYEQVQNRGCLVAKDYQASTV